MSVRVARLQWLCDAAAVASQKLLRHKLKGTNLSSALETLESADAFLRDLNVGGVSNSSWVRYLVKRWLQHFGHAEGPLWTVGSGTWSTINYLLNGVYARKPPPTDCSFLLGFLTSRIQALVQYHCPALLRLVNAGVAEHLLCEAGKFWLQAGQMISLEEASLLTGRPFVSDKHRCKLSYDDLLWLFLGDYGIEAPVMTSRSRRELSEARAAIHDRSFVCQAKPLEQILSVFEASLLQWCSQHAVCSKTGPPTPVCPYTEAIMKSARFQKKRRCQCFYQLDRGSLWFWWLLRRRLLERTPALQDGWAYEVDKSHLQALSLPKKRKAKITLTDEDLLHMVLGVFFPTAPARELLADVPSVNIGASLSPLLFCLFQFAAQRWPFGRACHFKFEALPEVSLLSHQPLKLYVRRRILKRGRGRGALETSASAPSLCPRRPFLMERWLGHPGSQQYLSLEQWGRCATLSRTGRQATQQVVWPGMAVSTEGSDALIAECRRCLHLQRKRQQALLRKFLRCILRARGCLLETLLAGIPSVMWPDPVLGAQRLFACEGTRLWQTRGGVIVFAMSGHVTPWIWMAIAKSFTAPQFREAQGRLRITLEYFASNPLCRGRAQSMPDLGDARPEGPPSGSRLLVIRIQAPKRGPEEPPLNQAKLFWQGATRFLERSRWALQEEPFGPRQEFLLQTLRDQQMPWTAAPERIFEYLVRQGLSDRLLQAFGLLWLESLPLDAVLPSYCADCSDWVDIRKCRFLSGHYSQVYCALLCPLRDLSAFRLLFPGPKLPLGMQDLCAACSSVAPSGGKGRWVLFRSDWGPCWMDQGSLQPTPVFFEKTCASPRMPAKEHFPFLARKPADPLQPPMQLSPRKLHFV